jgi:RNA polymerase sigma-70 factor (ECF subfamily)
VSRDETLNRLRERIVRFAASRVGRDVAEDLAQDALLLLATKYAELSAPEDLVPLAFRIIRLKMMAYRRKATRRGETAQHDDVTGELPDSSLWHAPEEQLRRRELSERLGTAVQRLSGRCRDIFRMKLDGHGFAEIQRALGARSINTVYTWDSRCRGRLLELMGGSWER